MIIGESIWWERIVPVETSIIDIMVGQFTLILLYHCC